MRPWAYERLLYDIGDKICFEMAKKCHQLCVPWTESDQGTANPQQIECRVEAPVKVGLDLRGRVDGSGGTLSRGTHMEQTPSPCTLFPPNLLAGCHRPGAYWHPVYRIGIAAGYMRDMEREKKVNTVI